jgi:flavin reductase (DIM6/NTAB) family NADH-FMN oxidoreductase RutF
MVTEIAPRISEPDAYDHSALRTALGHYATGVAVVTTTGSDGHPAGITINSFGSLSLDPPLILWCLQRSSASLATFTTADHFAVNVLAAGQERVARQFSARGEDRFGGLRWHHGPHGMPTLDDGLGVFVCRRLRHIHGGDHVIIIGHLERYQVTPGRSPLVFYSGRYLNVLSATAVSKTSEHTKGGKS